jgi:acyl-CoA synthetase (AMP-forming)/AMP-acid ligase II
MANLRSLAELLPPPGSEICVHASNKSYSRTEIRNRAEAIGQSLRDIGLESGAPVGVLLDDAGDMVAAVFAIWLSGGVVVPLNPRFTESELRGTAQQVDLFGLVTSGALRERVPDRPAVVLGGSTISVRSGVAGAARHDQSVALISFTSGTTGTPKPVPLLHERVMEGLDQVLQTLRSKPLGPTGPWGSTGRTGSTKPPMPNLIPVPLSLWAGVYQVLFAFTVGAPIVVMESFQTLEFASLVRSFGIRSTVLPPAAMVMLADDERIEDLSPLRFVRSISSPLSPLQARRFRDRFGIQVLNGYGQTELGGEVVGWSGADASTFGDDKLGAVGRPHPGVQVRSDDETGELLVRIPGRFDDWQHTGDVARIDDDGFVWIEGRVSDMINRGGLKVHPAEVEEVLRLVPALADVAVVGVPDDRLGEVPVAFIIERAPVANEELESACRAHLAPYKVPARFARVNALPRNELGKIVKMELLATEHNR